VVQVASGSMQTLALSDNGQVFLWTKSEGGGGYNRPKNITTTIHPTATFVYIACGEDHSAAISKGGEVIYTYFDYV
jgi:alpha-tubulin suppressor-like RCC1 family protein